MNRKKVISISLCVTLMILCFSGCGKSVSNKDENVKNSDSQKLQGMIKKIDVNENQITIASMKMDQQPPAKPDVDNTQDRGNQPPEVPSGDDGKQMPQSEEKTYLINGNSELKNKDGDTITIKELSEGDFIEYSVEDTYIISLSISEPPQMNQGAMAGGPGGSQPSEYSTVNHYTADKTVDDDSQSSTGTDENIAWISDGAKVSLSGITAKRTSTDSTGGDQSSFYGVGAAYLVTDGVLDIVDSDISTNANGGAGVFAYGNGVANVSNTTIKTVKGTSGGIHVAGGGTLNAKNLTVETNGESSAAIRSDRGSGTMNVDGGTYTSNGMGSPTVYSTADISVSNATLSATNSEAVCIEGKNSLKLSNCEVTSNMPDNAQNDCKWSVILYQSMSGDSEVGNSTFEMKDGSLTSKAGGLFYTTNTKSSFLLENVDIKTDKAPDFFLKCTGNKNQRGWGTTGQNGANCKFVAKRQMMCGDVIWDSISTLDFSITNKSTLKGAFINDESNASKGGSGYANVNIDEDSTWIVTGDSKLSELTCKGTIRDEKNNMVSIVNEDGKMLQKGTSEYTITVSVYQ